MHQMLLEFAGAEHKLIYIDESGAFGSDFTKAMNLPYFILSAITISECDLDSINAAIEKIKLKHGISNELKSSELNDVQRLKLLQDIKDLNFDFFTYVIDKEKIYDGSPLNKFKPVFYKYSNRLLHTELMKFYSSMDIFADEIGDEEFMESFQLYVRKNTPPIKRISFEFLKSHESNLIQLADFISGIIGRIFNFRDECTKKEYFIGLLDKKIISFRVFPEDYKTYLADPSVIESDEYDEVIASYCLNRILDYLEDTKNESDQVILHRRTVLEMLLNNLQFNINNGYIYSSQLISKLNRLYSVKYNRQFFSKEIIAGLRDEGIILASGTMGYKIPVNLEEVYSYTNHTMHIVVPMLERLKKCRDNLLTATSKEYDLLDVKEYEYFKEFLDSNF